RRRRTFERQGDLGPLRDPQREIDLVLIVNHTIDAHAGLQTVLSLVQRIHALDAPADLEKIVLVADLHLERRSYGLLVDRAWILHRERRDDGLCPLRTSRLRHAAEPDVVTEVEPEAAIALAHGPRHELSRDIVLGDPDMIAAVHQIGGVHEAEI